MSRQQTVTGVNFETSQNSSMAAPRQGKNGEWEV